MDSHDPEREPAPGPPGSSAATGSDPTDATAPTTGPDRTLRSETGAGGADPSAFQRPADADEPTTAGSADSNRPNFSGAPGSGFDPSAHGEPGAPSTASGPGGFDQGFPGGFGDPAFASGGFETGDGFQGGGGALWSGQRRLSRAREGKIVAGVCAGLARATGTDPILYRVVLGVLVFFGGVGALLYLVAWLVLPADGEAASPLESVLGRGKSSTPPLLTVGLAAAAVLLLIGTLSNGLETTLLLIGCMVAAALLLRRTGPHHGHSTATFASGAPSSTMPGPATAPPAAAHATSTTQMASAPVAPPAPAAPPRPPEPPRPPAAPPAGAWAGPAPSPTPVPAAAPPHAPAPAAAPTHAPTHAPTTPSYSSPYTPAFAPHGPYGAGAPQPPSPPVPTGRRGKRKKERSVLGRLTFSLACLATVVLVIVDVSGVHVPFTGYVALALGIVAFGMFVGVWFGRARWLILLGIPLALALGVGSVAETVGGFDGGAGDFTYAPTALADVKPQYTQKAGDLTVDLSQVPFAGADRTVVINSGFGDLGVTLPPDVDVDLEWDVAAGDADVPGTEHDGSGVGLHDNLHIDGTKGHLLLKVHLAAGDLEVK